MPSLSFLESEIDLGLAARLEKVAAHYPEQLALDDGSRTVTFAGLNHAANRVAQAILEHASTGHTSVASLFDFGIDSIIALLGIVKAGKIFVGLEAWFPVNRLQSILAETDAGLILAAPHHAALAREAAPSPGVVVLPAPPFDTAPFPAPGLFPRGGDNLFGIFFTSGTTGKPKGVIVSGRMPLHRARTEPGMIGVAPGDRQPLFYSFSFKASLSDLFNPLLNGATVCPFNLRELGTSRLAGWLRAQRITLLRPSISILRGLMDAVQPGEGFPDLRAVSVGGAKVFDTDVRRFRQIFPDTTLLHHLAASEAGLVARFEITEALQPRNGFYPVGRAPQDKEILILDEQHTPVPPGEEGEIAVRSRYLSPGYWRDPALTARKFLSAGEPGVRIFLTGDLGRFRPDGLLEHLGRKDFMVKVRGYRVEIAEVEAALHALPSVREAVVVAHKDALGETQLVAYLIPAGAPPRPASIRRDLARTFPDYMIPARYVLMDSFPLTGNTKVDRNALPPPGRARPELSTPFEAARTPLETTLAAAWAEALDVETVGIHDHLFDLGGHSLLAMRLVGRVGEALALDIPLKLLLHSPTVAGMAEAVAGYESALAPDLAALLGEIEAMSDTEVEAGLLP